MTLSFILDQAKSRMQALGHKRYEVQMRTLNLAANRALVMDSYNSLLYVPSDRLAPYGIEVESNFGLLKLLSPTHNEQCYEHRGRVEIRNTSSQVLPLQIVLLIPKPSSKPELQINS